MNNYITKEGYIIKKTIHNRDLIAEIKKELTVTPHLAFKHKNLKPKPFAVYRDGENHISVPKFYGINKFGMPKIDNMEKGADVNINIVGELRETQKIIVGTTVAQMDKIGGGLIVAGCGQGKTRMGLEIACHYKKKTLIIVHKTFLLNQWVERIQQFTNARIGIIQQNKVEIEDKDIVVGMLQSIAKDKYESDVFMDFGLIIFDEAHHAPSEYFSRALPIINCHLTLGLSATPKRADKMEKVLFWYLGDIAYQAPPNVNNNVNVKAYNYDVKHKDFKEARVKFGGDINRPKTINRIVSIDKRNEFIVDIIKEVMEEPQRKILILSDRIEHLEVLKQMIDNIDMWSCEFYIGGMKQTKLDESAEADIILGSYGMAAEGLDIPTLNTLILATPRREVEQAVGRITRKADHPVQPLIIDIVDMLPCFVNQGSHRRKFYKKLQFNIEVYEVEDSKVVAKIDLNNTVDISELKNIKIKNENVDFIDD
jgi:superfamily II DNA or RNA helicase